ncbi:MAG: AAA family ATPase [Thermodesulfobacteriota bacterium]
MVVKTGRMTKGERTAIREQADRCIWNSRFEFLTAHNGHRPGKIHVYLATPGGGKSTLGRSLILDAINSLIESKEPGNILLWLSEESREDFLVELDRSGFDNKHLDRLLIFSEFDESDDLKSSSQVLTRLWEICNDEDNNIVLTFLDNITTSATYMDQKPSIQSQVANALKRMASKLDIPLIIFAHTGAEINDNINRLINMNDIRGGKAIVNLAEFFYIMQRFILDQYIYPTLRITKHRGQDVDHGLYRIEYDREHRVYKQGFKLDFKAFKEAYNQRNTL